MIVIIALLSNQSCIPTRISGVIRAPQGKYRKSWADTGKSWSGTRTQKLLVKNTQFVNQKHFCFGCSSLILFLLVIMHAFLFMDKQLKIADI